jgi:hypothetical protein
VTIKVEEREIEQAAQLQGEGHLPAPPAPSTSQRLAEDRILAVAVVQL